MSTILLFVTAPVSSQLVNDLLAEHIQEPDLCSESTFSMIRDPSQPLSEIDIPGTKAPIQSFDSGFISASDATLWEANSRYQAEVTKSRATFIASQFIAILDAQSEEQRTVRMLYQSSTGVEGDWRVEFKFVETVVADLPRFEEYYFSDGVVAEDGVLDIGKIRKAMGIE